MNIELSHINKSFGSKQVLLDVSVKFEGGKINALLGENGAGKSTLANLIARESYVQKVDQNPLLVDEISVKQNILCGHRLSKKIFDKKLKILKQEWKINLNLNKKILDCTQSQKFFTSLFSALIVEPKVLILDEPTRSLEWNEKLVLFSNLRTLAQKGCNILIITHSIEEALFYTDTITVLEHGKVTAFYDESKNFDREKHNFSSQEKTLFYQKNEFLKKTSANNEILLKIENLVCKPKNRPSINIKNLEIQKAKVNLIFLPAEEGLFTLENILTGIETSSVKGKLIWKQNKKIKSRNLRFKKLTPHFVRCFLGKNKTAVLFSDKIFHSSNPEITVEQLVCVNQKQNFFFPDTFTLAKKIINEAKINTSPKEKVKTLSGGMLQKLLFEKELSFSPQLLILSEPLQGLDYNSAIKMCQTIKSLTFSGKTVIILSSTEYPEIFADTIYPQTKKN